MTGDQQTNRAPRPQIVAFGEIGILKKKSFNSSLECKIYTCWCHISMADPKKIQYRRVQPLQIKPAKYIKIF